jgi:hypothetical protein
MPHCWPDPGMRIERKIDTHIAVLRKKIKAIKPTEEN